MLNRTAFFYVLIGVLAMAAIATALHSLEQTRSGVVIETKLVGSTPATVFSPKQTDGPGANPVVLIAHGFSGSQQLMQPFALTFAHNGYTAITFDFPGHGRHPAPMRGGLSDQDASLKTLLKNMQEMGDYAAWHAGVSGAYAVLGHSMASDIIVRHAQSTPGVVATVGVSMFAPSITDTSATDDPPNLLAIAGGLEPALMAIEALRIVSRSAGPDPALATTYGKFSDGSARRAVLAPGVEHIGVLYSRASQTEALTWLDRAFGRPAATKPVIDARGISLGLLLVGLLALAWPGAKLLPVIVKRTAAQTVTRLKWWQRRGYAPLALIPMALTPLILWQLPTQFLPLLLGDYLLMHFALYGLLTIAALFWLKIDYPRIPDGRTIALTAAVVLTCFYTLVIVGFLVDRYIFNLLPDNSRLPLIPVMCAGTLIYFIADEWASRHQEAARGAYFIFKACFLFSLVLALALNPSRLFFLALIVPAILVLFVCYGLMSRWCFRQTGHPLIAGVALAITFGWFMAAFFPLVR